MTTPERPGRKSHSLADHAFGAAVGHDHAPGEDHDHEHDAGENLITGGSQELARVELISIGIDIGSSGTQIAFSRLLMHGPGEPAAMRRHVRSRETLYLSPVVLTPFLKTGEIDIERLRGTIARAFEASGLAPDDVETGAIILTGAAARAANASSILEELSLETGDIVATAAGDHYEAALAASGSGALDHSRATMTRILNIDIGGATTKLAIAENGRIVATAALNIGGRQIVVNGEGRIVRLEAAAAIYGGTLGFDWAPGKLAGQDQMEHFTANLAEDIMAAINPEIYTRNTKAQFLTPPISCHNIDGIMFSGGIAEYIYGLENRDFSDAGKHLGLAISKLIKRNAMPAALLPAGQCIRATVLGCSEFTTQLSGATSFITNHATLLPRRNLPVLQPPFHFSTEIDSSQLAHSIQSHRQAFGDGDGDREVVYAFRWRGEPEYRRMLAFAKGISEALADRIAAGTNLYLLVEGDTGFNLGAILQQDLNITNDLLVLDSVVLRDFDYVDIGRMRLPSGMVPVTVKSLLFPGPKDN